MQVQHNSGPGLMLGIPTLGRPVPLEWALNFKSMNAPTNYNVDFNLIMGREIGYARNALAKAAIERKVKYLFFLGDDIVPPPHALRQLIYRAEQTPDLGVVAGVYCTKADPPEPLVYKGNGRGCYWDWKIGEFFEVTGVGMDCTLLRMDLFEKLSEPWFKTVDEDQHLDGKAKLEAWTEDLYFLNKVSNETSYKIYCDAGIICDHWDVYGRRAYQLPKDSLPMRQKGVLKDKRCLVLGPLIPLADESYDVTRCTQDGDLTADYRLRYDLLPFEEEQFDFTIVSDYVLDVDRHIGEWRRVTKKDSKIAFNVHPALNIDYLVKEYSGTLNGSFIEVTKQRA